jgi:hypothetical protein
VRVLQLRPVQGAVEGDIAVATPATAAAAADSRAKSRRENFLWLMGGPMLARAAGNFKRSDEDS